MTQLSEKKNSYLNGHKSFQVSFPLFLDAGVGAKLAPAVPESLGQGRLLLLAHGVELIRVEQEGNRNFFETFLFLLVAVVRWIDSAIDEAALLG